MYGNLEYTKKSKPGAVGEDMPGAMKGARDHEGAISGNYKGRPRNADPNFPYRPSGEDAKSVSQWTKEHMKKRREEAREQKKN
ncbi:unnamed protein product [Bursaphelenchus xylophilus]|uniref:(pine wood nematode) hypothetical protein n=1 Tax=Bursaphelenchus xylophilus TaxID=6326 RepID=A0A1I7SHT3_BURXY|nr:unnamed protein product [Bursaphelenchus xylophilus]CAG9105057.1 unnamed protein product [Bursaphelenchus xylophilus]